jgi:hypothetical protein
MRAAKRGAAAHPLLHRYIDPLDPTGVEHAAAGGDWIKFDSYRAHAHKGNGASRSLTPRLQMDRKIRLDRASVPAPGSRCWPT